MAFTPIEKYRRWFERHRPEREAARLARGPRRGGPAGRYRVFVLIADGIAGFVGVGRLGEEPWRLVWDRRSEIPGPLSEWMRTLAAPPTEVVILGSVGLHAAAGVRDLLAGPRAWPGWSGRPVAVITGDRVEVFATLGSAARAAGIGKDMALRLEGGYGYLRGGEQSDDSLLL
jgi:hypothetical protein